MMKPDRAEAIEVLRTAGRATAAEPDVVAALDAVGCEIGARPAGAPTIEDITPHIRAVRRTDTAIAVEFDPAARATVAAFVAAEQQCCSGITFTIAAGEPLVMQVEAPPDALAVVEGWIASA